jgi:NitT/TauT family transport system substrate-binding protein
MTKRRMRPLALLSLLVVMAMVAAACGDSTADTTVAAETTAASDTTSAPDTTAAPDTTSAPDTTAAPATTEPMEVVEIDYLTSFSTFGRDAYVYVAEELGYFDEVGLDVTINPGSGTVDVMRLIAAGTADFGPGDAATAILTIANQGLEVRAVAAIQQQTLAALATTESTGIASVEDLEGKTFADAAGSTVRILFPFYADAAGFDDSTVEFVPAPPPDLPRLLASGQVDYIGQFVVGRGLIESATGDTAVFFPYSEYLPDLYGNLLIARTEMIEEQPEVVERFVTALMRGLEYSIQNAEETGTILADYVAEQNPEVAAGEVTIMAPYVQPEGFTDPIGSIDPAKIETIISQLGEAGALENDVTVDQVFAPGFVTGG